MVRQLVGGVVIAWAALIGAVETLDLAVVSIDSVEYGDCLLYASADEIFPIKIVPCDTAHDAQAFDSIDLSHYDSFPGEAVFMEEWIQVCMPQFENFVGSEPLDSKLFANSLMPRWESWNHGSQSVLCVAESVHGQIDFDAQDSGR